MNIYIEHNAAMVADLGNEAQPACDGIIMKLGDPRDVLAVTVRGNPLADGWMLDTELPAKRVVTWSGSLADDLFGSDPMTWMRAGHDAFATFCEDVRPQLQRHDWTLCFQPHARHVLSDPHSCVRFAREHHDGPFGIAFSPMSMLEASMLDHIDEHLTRAFETISVLGDANAMLVLHDIFTDDTFDPTTPLPLGRGGVPRELVRSLMTQHVPDEMPIVLMPDEIDRQLNWLDATREGVVK